MIKGKAFYGGSLTAEQARDLDILLIRYERTAITAAAQPIRLIARMVWYGICQVTQTSGSF